MAPAAAFLIAGGRLLVTSLLATSSSNDVLLEVCMSPGCVADGAADALDQLEALAPTHRFCVKSGVCVSACGKGPVVKQDDKVIHKYVSEPSTLLESLLEEPLPEQLVQGYEKVSQAKKAVKEEDLKAAVSLYKEGIDTALETVMERTKQHDNFNDESPSDTTTPVGLTWMVQAHSGLAQAMLETKEDMDGAQAVATKACELSKNMEPDCLKVLAAICQAKGDDQGELEALQALFAIPVDDNLPLAEANVRRTLGFRLAKLEREAK